MGSGAKLTPRQKMINLMYLIFIAMLALNMSKEVLSAFGLMNEKLTESNIVAEDRNIAFVKQLELKAKEAKEKYEPLKKKADQIHKLAHDFDSYIADLKDQMTADIDEDSKDDYEIMDKADFLDQLFFKGDKLRAGGEEFISQMTKFKEGVAAVLKGEKGMDGIVKEVNKKFSTDPVENRDGQKQEYLDYNYKGFPLIASLTKLTQIQSDIKTTESEILSKMLAGVLLDDNSMNNYTTLLTAKKSAYFNGETYDGEIVLGRRDESTKPNEVELTLDGRKLEKDKDFTIEGGKVKMNVNSGRPGEHQIKGKLIFNQDGEVIEVPVDQSFATIPKPNAATISADKMNVVYRGVSNPMTISFAGIPDNKVNASAPGLSRVSGSRYAMNVTSIRGREVTISVTGKLPDGKPVGDKATFRIKDLPKPTGTVRGEDGAIKMQRQSLEIATVGAKFEDFDFKLPLRVTGFKFKVPGQPTIIVSGSKLDSRAKGALRKAKRGSDVTIFDIQAKASGVTGVKLKKVSPVIIELTN